ncbi:MAG: hypothetical protein JOZ36_01615 [Acidobacteria bacterium]|nr:hypothetical protein [Acidobacteriota bacterium]
MAVKFHQMPAIRQKLNLKWSTVQSLYYRDVAVNVDYLHGTPPTRFVTGIGPHHH